MDVHSFSLLYKTSYLFVLVPTLLIIISAIISAKQIGGSLGDGIKKIAAGTVIHTVMILAFVFQELGFKGVLQSSQIQLFFLTSGLLGALLLIWGYAQVYRVAKKLKLFTV
ncbi:MAG: hypothetical protein QG639_579 [Patescibacteria group bacterium]|jgi:hypothetical protein|nr:hypothetical protein [Patescibacteria group bacterium]